jgi:hypothetical protein
MCSYSWTTVPNVNAAQNAAMKWIKIEGEHPDCHFTINEGDGGDAVPSR